MSGSTAVDSEDAVKGVNDILDEYQRCWSSLDFERLRSLWDSAEPDPIYVAEEHREAFVGYAQIEAYWEKTKAPLRRACVRTWNRMVKTVSTDICIAHFNMRWMVELKPDGPMIVGASDLVDGRRVPVGGDVRVTAVFRKTAAGWRFIHYVEAPIGFLTQLATMHESWVDDAFRVSSESTDQLLEKGIVNG